jgi:WD40 repeat protein
MAYGRVRAARLLPLIALHAAALCLTETGRAQAGSAFSGPALASQALSELSQTTAQETTRNTLKSIAERREQESMRCAEGFSRVDGTCERNRPPVVAPSPRLKKAKKRKGTAIRHEEEAAKDLPSGPILRIETGQHGAIIHRIDTDAENRFAVTASDDKTVRLWSLPDGKLLLILRLPLDLGHIGKATAVAISPDGNTVAAGGWTGIPGHNNIFLFDRSSGKLTKRLADLPDAVFHLAYSPDGQRLAAALGRKGIRVFDASHGYRLLPSDAAQYKDQCNWAMFDRAGRLVTASSDGFIRLYAAGQYKVPVARFRLEGHQPYAAAFSPDGKRVAVGFEDSPKVVVLSGSDLTKLFEADTAGVPNAGLPAVEWSQHGRLLFAGGLWAVNDVFQVRRWSDGGRGAFVDIPVAGSNRIVEFLVDRL